jgi:hypothetical protein
MDGRSKLGLRDSKLSAPLSNPKSKLSWIVNVHLS